MARKRDTRIIEIEKPYIERERKFVPVVPPDVAAKGEEAIAAYKTRKLLLIADHIRLSADTFVTADHPDLAPVIPAALKAHKFDAEYERTKPRERVYYADADLKVRSLGVEFRQEANRRYGVKQTIKIARNVKRPSATLNRIEMHARLTGPGVALDVAEDRKDRRFLRRHFNEAQLKPGFRMVSQRIRIPYFPEGNTDVMIELACDYTLFGETVFGRCWNDPKLEIEILKGPADEEECRRILEREEKRIMDEFDLEPQLESNAEIGYRYLAQDLATARGAAAYERLGAREIWWDRAARARRGLG